jgi:serine/threonine-protein kinase Chk2
VSGRHCIIFPVYRDDRIVPVLQRLSTNDTLMNDIPLWFEEMVDLKDESLITIFPGIRFIFRTPEREPAALGSFATKYTMHEKLGMGHFATVFACVEKSTGRKLAAKCMNPKGQPDLQPKACLILMGIQHPHIMSLWDAFEASSATVYVLELVPEGELFYYIVMKQKLSEDETRTISRQVFSAVRYLVRLISRFIFVLIELTLSSTTEELSTEISNPSTFCSLPLTTSM